MYRAVVIGVSAGGLQALRTILPALPGSFPLPVAIVQHVGHRSDSFLPEYLNGISKITVKEAEDKEPLRAGYAYFAPAGYHLLIEPDQTFSLSVDDRVNFACPAIDVLFESAADVFAESLIGVVLTGANKDGARGLSVIKERGGIAIVQDPRTAEAEAMPKAALEMTKANYIVTLEQLAPLLLQLSMLSKEENYDSCA